jgi:oligopeptide/dipeptide ABC transporter ATP-binding protein
VSEDVIDEDQPILSVDHLSVDFPTDDGVLHAVDDVSFDVMAHETMGIVGESGSGKTVTSMAILGLLPKRAKVSGRVLFRGRDLRTLAEKELEQIRGLRIAMVFQDALAALNPAHKVGDQIAEAITVHQKIGREELKARVVELLDLVGIPNPSARAEQYPHEFSGGMRQRAMIAMAIANDPDLLIADEPTTALDVTIQAQVLDVFDRIQERTQSALVLITHDLGVVAGVADRVMVMYAGRQVELAGVEALFYRARHPYTAGLLGSLPRLDRRVSKDDRLQRITGHPPSLVFRPSGCAFNPRCPNVHADGRCVSEVPALRVVEPEHLSACHFVEEIFGPGGGATVAEAAG